MHVASFSSSGSDSLSGSDLSVINHKPHSSQLVHLNLVFACMQGRSTHLYSSAILGLHSNVAADTAAGHVSVCMGHVLNPKCSTSVHILYPKNILCTSAHLE